MGAQSKEDRPWKQLCTSISSDHDSRCLPADLSHGINFLTDESLRQKRDKLCFLVSGECILGAVHTNKRHVGSYGNIVGNRRAVRCLGILGWIGRRTGQRDAHGTDRSHRD